MKKISKIVTFYEDGTFTESYPFNPLPLPPKETTWNKCTQCGLTGVNGYVCPDHNCPTRITCT